MHPARTPRALRLDHAPGHGCRHGAAAALALAAAAVAAPPARGQIEAHSARIFVPPPPAETSTGGAPVDPDAAVPLNAPPRLRGRELVTRDVLHADAIELSGLEQSDDPYRPDLSVARGALGEAAEPIDENELHRRQLALYSGELLAPTAPDDGDHEEEGEAEQPEGAPSAAPPKHRSLVGLGLALAAAVSFAFHRLRHSRGLPLP